jgi:hypothetical protein
MGTLTSWNPLGHSRPVMGLLYLYLLPEEGSNVFRKVMLCFSMIVKMEKVLVNIGDITHVKPI